MKFILLLILFLLPANSLMAEKILVFRKASDNYQKVYSSIKSEIGEDHELIDSIIDSKTSYKHFATLIRRHQPNLLLLMDNKAVNFAQRFNQEKDYYARNLRAVATMGLNLRQILKGSKNIAAVEYEVPAYSIIVQYRDLVKQPVKKVLVFYRASEHQQMIERTRKQLAGEGIELLAVDCEVEGKSKREVEYYLKKNFEKQLAREEADVLWVISDSVLLNPDTFSTVWVHGARKFKTSFISGVGEFTQIKMNFCTFAASPDYKELGVQTAQIIFAIVEDGEDPQDLGVEYILSVSQSVNEKRFQELKIIYDKEKLKQVLSREN